MTTKSITRKKQIKKETLSDNYLVTLNLNNELLRAEGETVMDCLDSFAKQPFYKTKGILTVTKGGMNSEKLFTLQQLKRLFVNRIYREIIAKQMTMYCK